MKVFMSWSGQRSKLTAELLYDWIKCVIQAAQPWISSKGIERGALWFSEINNELKDTAVGIICLTQENKNAPWILFEAGALAKGLSTNRVCTLLVDLKSTDLQPPLAQFNHTFPDKESMWSLVTTLNNGLEQNRLDLPVLQRVFETYWPQFQDDFAKIISENPQTTHVEPRKDKEILAEILDTTRSMSSRIRTLEERNARNHAIPRGLGLNSAAAALRHPELDNLTRDSAITVAKRHIINGMTHDALFEYLMTEFRMGKKSAKEVIEAAAGSLGVLPSEN